MAHLFSRGPKSGRRWYAQYRDIDGGRKTRLLPGVRTKDEARDALATIRANILRGQLGLPKVEASKSFASVFQDWTETLRNRAADKYKGAGTKHILPAFPGTLAGAQEVSTVLVWVDKLRAHQGKGKLSEGSIRRVLTVLSAFWTWAIERGLATSNPVRMMPRARRPKRKVRQVDTPWIRGEQDDVVHRVMAELDEPFRTAFWLGNRSGLRPGELAGLRLKDLDKLADGVIRVGRSFAGPLKEDKDSTGKTKLVPAPLDAEKVLAPIIKARRAEGAGPDDVLFKYQPKWGRSRKNPAWEGMTIDSMNDAWTAVQEKVPEVVNMRWYDATRHSFVSRSLAAGASMDEVSAAVGHSSVVVTRAAYDHFERTSFSDALRAPLAPVIKPRK